MINLQNVQVKNGSTWQKICPFPIGFVYSSYTDTSPGSTFGGTWTPITGRFPYFNAGTDMGGSNSYTLTVAQMPSHTHTFYGNWPLVASGDVTNGMDARWGQGNIGTGLRDSGYTGGGSEIDNMPAYQTLYAWRRTA